MGRSKFSTYTAPKSVGTKVITKSARLRKAPSNSLCISNRELAFSVLAMDGSETYSVVTFRVQPGLSSIFPLLSNTAKSFTRYKMKFCVDFVPSVGTDSEGTLFMAYNRNVNEPPPSSVQQFMTFAGATSANIWSQSSFPSNRGMIGHSEKMLFTRYTSLTENDDPLQYDMGNFHVGLSGINSNDFASGSVLGQLYITYEVHFYDQRVLSTIEANLFSYYKRYQDSPNVTLPENAEALIDNVFGGGDVIYEGSFAQPAPEAGSQGATGLTTGVTLIFPSAGFYIVQQTGLFSFSGAGPSGTTSIQMQPFGGTSLDVLGNSIVSSMDGARGAGVQIAPAIQTAAVWSNASFEAEAICIQIIRVLTSGTYLLGEEAVIGSGWISKGVGLDAYTISETTNEVQVYKEQNPASGDEIILLDVNIEITQIDAEVASYYAPTAWGSLSPSPLANSTPRTPTRHLHHSAVSALALGYHRRRPKASSSKIPRITHQAESDEPEAHTLVASPISQPSEYEKFLEWKKKTQL